MLDVERIIAFDGAGMLVNRDSFERIAFSQPVVDSDGFHGVIYVVGLEGLLSRFDGVQWHRLNASWQGDLVAVAATSAGVYVIGTGSPFTSTRLWCVDLCPPNSIIIEDNDLVDVAATEDSTVFAITSYAAAAYLPDGEAISGPFPRLNAVWGLSNSFGVAVGDSGRVVLFDGVSWTVEPPLVLASLRAVWGRDEQEVFAVGTGGTILSYNGEVWRVVQSAVTEDLSSIHGLREKRVTYAGGLDGAIVRNDGANWNIVNRGTRKFLRDVAIASNGDACAVGDDGIVVTRAGTQWIEEYVPIKEQLNAVCVTAERRWLAVGNRGTLLAKADLGWEVLGNTSQDLFDVGALDVGVVACGESGWFANVIDDSVEMVRFTNQDLFALAQGNAEEVLLLGATHLFHLANRQVVDSLEIPSPSFSGSMASKSGTTIVVGGSRILELNGRTWRQATNPIGSRSVYSVWFGGDGTAYAVASDGYVLQRDVDSWIVRHTGIYGVSGAERESELLIVGSLGLIFHYLRQ